MDLSNSTHPPPARADRGDRCSPAALVITANGMSLTPVTQGRNPRVGGAGVRPKTYEANENIDKAGV